MGPYPCEPPEPMTACCECGDTVPVDQAHYEGEYAQQKAWCPPCWQDEKERRQALEVEDAEH